jgi:hypothetical protein
MYGISLVFIIGIIVVSLAYVNRSPIVTISLSDFWFDHYSTRFKPHYVAMSTIVQRRKIIFIFVYRIQILGIYYIFISVREHSSFYTY